MPQMEAVHPDLSNLGNTLEAVPGPHAVETACNAAFFALDYTLGSARNTFSQPRSAIQGQGCGLPLQNLVPEDPFGGMPTITSKASTLYTVKHGHSLSLTITLKDWGHVVFTLV